MGGHLDCAHIWLRVALNYIYSYSLSACLRLAFTKYFCFRAFGILIIEDNDKAWFPSEDLREFHGIVPHQVTTAEKTLFCIREDGSEGLCCPVGGVDEDDT